jgi:hypothetical protein
LNLESFSIVGYASVALWICVPLVWLLHWKRPRRVLCRLALLLAVAAFVLAKTNSVDHVDKIQLDRSEQMAAWKAQQEVNRKAAAESRGEDVAQIRFAEDASGDFLDKAGMDEADLKYIEKLQGDGVPDWKKDKKNRSAGGADDDSLEGLIGGERAGGGLESDSLESATDAAPVLMLEKDLILANRLDTWNLSLIRWLIAIAVMILALDYLRRANLYREASFPLPLPSAWINSLTPIAPVRVRPEHPRRKLPAELAWLLKRGDCFVYLTDSQEAAEKALAQRRPRADVLRVGEGHFEIDDEFIFEALWFGRSSFVIDSADRAETLFARFLELMEERKSGRARVRQNAHVVWDLRAPIPDHFASEFERLAEKTGLSLFIVRSNKP